MSRDDVHTLLADLKEAHLLGCYLLQKHNEPNDFVKQLLGSYRQGKLPLCS